jgi:hypothetical protein
MSRRMRYTGNVARIGDHCIEDLVGKPKGMKLLGSRRHRWDNIEMDLSEIECGYSDGINLTWYRKQWRALVKKVMNFWVL